jgi:alkanesulfonate monooxygenase SsuD/methylene tetrahydromethanopterin reductase-like flavin-dependent oxidoreductase (luciferase family)
MEAISQSDDYVSLTAQTEDTAVLTLVEDEFESIFDVPFITVNKVDGQFQAEVILSGDPETDLERIQEALDVGTVYGVHAYARVHSEFGHGVLIYFTPDEIEELSRHP